MGVRKAFAIPLVLLAVLGGALAFAYIERTWIATYAAKRYLTRLGVEEPQLEIVDLTLERVEVTGVGLGEEGLNADAVRLEFTFVGDGLLPQAVDLQRVEIDGLEVALNLTGEGPLLPGLEPLLAVAQPPAKEPVGDGEAAREKPPLIAFDPLRDAFEVELNDSQLTITTDRGPIKARLASDISRDADGGMVVDVRGDGEGPGGRASGRARLTFTDDTVTHARAELQLSEFAVGELEPRRVDLSLEADDYSLSLAGDLLLDGGTLSGFAFLQAQEPLISLAAPPGSVGEVLSILEKKDWTLQAAINGNALEHPAVIAPFDIDGSFNLEKSGASLRLTLPSPTTATFTSIEPALLAALGAELPAEIEALLANPLALRVEGLPDRAALSTRLEDGALGRSRTNLKLQALSALSPQLDAQVFGSFMLSLNNGLQNIDITTELHADNLNFGELGRGRIGYQGRIQHDRDATALSGRLKDLSWTVEGLAPLVSLSAKEATFRARLSEGLAQLTLGAGLTLGVDASDLPVQPPEGGFDLKISGLTARIPIADPAAAEASAELKLPEGRLALAGEELAHEGVIAKVDYGAETIAWRVESQGVDLPAYQIQFRDLAATGDWGGDAPTARLEASVADLSVAQRFPPVTGALTAALANPADIPLTGRLSGLANRLKIDLVGTFQPERNRLALQATANPILFVPGGVQPADLHPTLAAMENAQGELRASASFALQDGALDSRGKVSLTKASFTTPLGEYSGFNSEIALSSLWPPRTEPGQEVTIETAEIEGLPFSAISGRFQLVEPEDPTLGAGLPDVQVDEAKLTFAEGRFGVRDMRIRPLSPNQDTVIEVESVDLTRLFELLDIEDVAATGRMSGAVPISLRGQHVLIEDAYLAADGPGVLQVNSAEAQAALLPADEYIGELVDALKDFHYELLTIGVNKPLTGDTLVTMRILGKNPEVLHGTSFDLNVNLETDLAPFLRALDDARDLRDELERDFIESLR